MNEEDFCKIVIFSLLNFMIYYLSIIFLTSTYNAKSQGNYYYSNIDDCKIHFNDSFNKTYKGIAWLFAFITIAFLVYIIVLIIVIKKNKFDLKTKNINKKENNITYGDNNGINELVRKGAPSDARIINVKFQIDKCSNTSEDSKEKDNIIGNNKEIFWLLISFIACQAFYLIELIILSAFHGETKSEEQNCKSLKNITKINTGLLIVGYIFFCIFIFFYIYIFILYRGKGVKKRLEKLTNSKYCECFNECIKKVCNKMIVFFWAPTDDEMKKQNEEKIRKLKENIKTKEKKIKDLEKYKHNLVDLNSILSRPSIKIKNNVIEDEFNKLHLCYLYNK